MNYKNVITNALIVKNMKNVKKFIFDKFCEFCLKKRQQIEFSKIFMIKSIKFLKKIHVDIKNFLFISVRNNFIFIFFKNDVIDFK